MWVQYLDRKIPCSGAWQPTSVFLPGESHGQRGAYRAYRTERTIGLYSPWSHKELDMT